MGLTFDKASIGLEAAERMITAAKQAAEEMGLKVSVAVCDESGVVKAMSRMDGAALITVQSAQDKAYTAAGFGVPTHKWYPRIKDEPALLHGLVGSIDRLVIYGGGVPIRIEDKVVGAIGVGGGSHHQDEEIASKAVSTVTG
jgi:uncharacterized protein GlcG (DUF336 family)